MPQIRPLDGQLKLQNGGALTLFPMGTGSAFAKTLYQNNLLIIKGADHLLIDCGTRTPEAFFRLGLPITEIKNLIITHSHADHIGGLEELILMDRYVAKHRPTIYIDALYQTQLWSNSLKGGAAWNERHGDTWLNFTDYFTVVRPKPIKGLGRNAAEVQVGTIKIVTLRTKHYPDSSATWQDSAYSIGLIIDDRILYTADTRFDAELINTACDNFPIEAIFHDTQFFPGGIHAPFDDLKTLPMTIKQKTWLMHYPDTWQNHAAKVEAEGFAGFMQQHHFYVF